MKILFIVGWEILKRWVKCNLVKFCFSLYNDKKNLFIGFRDFGFFCFIVFVLLVIFFLDN